MKTQDIARFVQALPDPAAAVPAGLVDAAGRPAGNRFDLYRNTVLISLVEALATSFPVVAKLVGPRSSPPRPGSSSGPTRRARRC